MRRRLFSRFANFSDRCAAPCLGEARAPLIERQTVRRIKCGAFVLLLVLLGARSIVAMPLDEYASRIHQALEELDRLWEEEEEEDLPADVYAARARATLSRVRALVPSDETIEWDGGRVRVNNSWLSEELKKYEQTPEGATLERISQRLIALEDRLTELKAQRAVGAKDQEKARLEAILRREEYGEKPPQKSLWERFKEWLNNLFPSRNPLQPGQSSWLSLVAMIVIFGLAASVLAYVLLKFLPILKRRKTGARLEKRRARVVLGEELAPDQTPADLLKEAEALARRGEIRAAIRKGYIALLFELGERKVLALAQHKTNHDYLRAVREKRPLLNEMQKLTASFENHWYGFVPATPDDWTNFRSGYQQTLKTAGLLSDE